MKTRTIKLMVGMLLFTILSKFFYEKYIVSKTLTNKTNCIQQSTRGEDKILQSETQYVAEYCPIYKIEGMGRNLKTVVRIYKEGEHKPIYEDVVPDSLFNLYSYWICVNNQPKKCALRLSYKSNLLGITSDEIIEMSDVDK